MKDNKLCIFNAMSTKAVVIQFNPNIDLETPKNMRDWKLVFASYVAANEPIVDDVILHFEGKRYYLDDNGEFVLEDNRKEH